MTANDFTMPIRPGRSTVELVPFSGGGRREVSDRLQEFGAALESSTRFEAVAEQAMQRRHDFNAEASARLVLILEAQDDIQDKINTALASLEKEETAQQVPAQDFIYGEGSPPGKLAFLYPGQGSQYPRMARDLFETFPEAEPVQKIVETCFNGEQRLFDFVCPEAAADSAGKNEQEAALRQTDVAQPAIGMVSLLMTKVLSRFGICPDAAAGHSFGELCALCAGGFIDENALLELAVRRGRLMAGAGGADKGTMLAVKAPLEQIESLILENGLDVILANRNAPDQGVLSGPTEAIEQMKSVCKEHRIRAMLLPVAAAFHSRLVEDAAVPFQEKLRNIAFGSGRIPVYANKNALPYPGEPDAARRLLGEQMVHPVHFLEEIRNMYADGVRTFVEVGPKGVLTGLVKSILKDKPFAAFSIDGSSGRRSGFYDLAVALGNLAALGYPLDLKAWGDWG